MLCRSKRQPERTALGVLADRPRVSWVHDAPAERFYAWQRCGQVGDLEVRQGEGVSGATPPSMDPHRGRSSVRLPAVSLSSSPSLEGGTEQLTPEASSSLRIIGGEFDQ